MGKKEIATIDNLQQTSSIRFEIRKVISITRCDKTHDTGAYREEGKLTFVVESAM
jgi:hypothetical protein